MRNKDDLYQSQIEREMDVFETWFLRQHRPDWSQEGLTRMKYAAGMGYSPSYVQAVWKGWLGRAKQGG